MKFMMGLTASQAQERLWEMQRRRGQIENDIGALQRCEDQMMGILQTVDVRIAQFRDASRRDQGNWRGQLGKNYHTSRTQSRINADSYGKELQAQIKSVSQFRSSLSNQLTDLHTTIRDLERIAQGGL